MSRVRRLTRVSLLLGVMVAVLAGVLAVGLIFSLRFAFIQQHVGYLVTRFAKKAGVFFVRAENITGNPPWQFHVDRVEVGDKDDVYITIEDAEISWHPLETWQPGDDVPYRIVVDWVRAKRVVWTRLPETIDEPDDKPFRWDRFPRILVHKLDVEHFEVGPNLLGGDRAVMEAHGNGVLGEWDQGRLDLKLTRTDGRRGAAHIDLSTSGSPVELHGSVIASEQEGGSLVHLARIPKAGAIDLNVQASGPMRDWRAHADVLASAIGKLGVDAHIAFGPTGAFDGTAKFDPVEEIRARSLLPVESGTIAIAARGAWVPDQVVRLDDVDAVVDGRALDASGRLDLVTDKFTLDAALDHQDTNALVVLRGFDIDSASGHAEGTIGDGGQLRADLDVKSPSSGSALAAMLRGALVMRDPAGEGLPSFELTVDGEGLRVGEETAPLLGDNARAVAAGTVDLSAGVVHAPSFVVTGAALRVEGPVDVEDDWGTVRGALVANSPDVSSLKNVTGTVIEGRASLRANVSLNDSGAVQVDVHGSADDVAIAEQGWNALIGSRVTLQGSASGNLSGPLQARASVGAAGIQADATASMAARGGELSADLTAVIDNLARLSDPMSASIAGRMTIDAKARGALDDFSLNAAVRGEKIVFEGTRLDELTLDASGRGLPDHVAGDIQAYARYGDLKARLTGKAAMPSPDRLVLSDVVVTGPATDAKVSLDVDLQRGVAGGRIVASSTDLALWRPFVGRGLGGSVSIDVALATAMQDGRSVQLVSGSMRGQKLALALDGEELLARSLDVTADGLEVGPSPRGSLRAELHDARVGTATLTDALVAASGDGRAWNVEAKAKGSAAGNVSLDSTARVSGKDGKYQASVTRLNAELADEPLRLLSPASVVWSDSAMQVSTASFAVGDHGKLVLALDIAPQNVTADADLDAVPLSLASAFIDGLDLTGTLSGTLDLRGRTLATAWAEAVLEGQGVGSGALASRGVAPVNARLNGRYENGHLAGKASLVGLTDTTLDATLDVPILEAGSAERVSGTLRWHGDIAEGASLLPLGEDVLRGRIDADLTLEGTMRAPRVGGTVTIEGGRYENGNSGLTLEDLRAHLRGEGASLVLTELAATDGNDGRIAVTGRLDFGELPAFQLALDLTATEALITRLDLITTKANATIALRASRGVDDDDVGGTISGEVRIVDARVRIPTEFAEEVPALVVVEVHGAAVDARDDDDAHEAIIDLALDIDVRGDNRIYVEGRALESEWKADLDVKGSTAQPLVDGLVESVRGQVGLLGKRFRFRTATLRFDGSKDNIPYLNLTAAAEANEITAIIDVRGPATRPIVELRSEPALPRDEVLSRVLFGESAADLTAMQSVQLARSVAELTGSPLGGGSGLLGRVGRSLGLDRLGLETSDAGGSALSATKYLSDKVYLRFDQGLTPEDSKASVEWEIFNHVTIESDVSQDAEGEVGLNWKWDY